MPQRKRAASTVLDEPRRSRRVTSTPKKSNYFEGDSGSDDPLGVGKPAKSNGKRASTRKSKLKDDDIASDEYEGNAGGDESGDDGQDDDDEVDTKVTVVKVPGLRPDGGMEYADGYVHKNTALFLKDLKQHNERTWLKCKYLVLTSGLRLTRISP